MPTIILTETGGLGDIVVDVPAARPNITPASRLCLQAIGRHRGLLSGSGIDWGSGSGCLAIAAARLATVEGVLGIEVDAPTVALANRNVRRNGVAGRVSVIEADLFEPVDAAGRRALGVMRGACDFLIANPPVSTGDDGLGWRRALLRGALDYLVAGAPVLMQMSNQYGVRIAALADDVPGFAYEGLLATTEWVPFDLGRADLARALADFAAAEGRGGAPYDFRDAAGSPLTATAALARAKATGESPRSRWQMHLYRRR